MCQLIVASHGPHDSVVRHLTGILPAGKHATDILRIALEGFSQSRGILTSLAVAATSKAPKTSTEGVGFLAEEFQGLDKMAAQNVIASKVRGQGNIN